MKLIEIYSIMLYQSLIIVISIFKLSFHMWIFQQWGNVDSDFNNTNTKWEIAWKRDYMEEKSLYLHSLVYLQRMASILYQKIDAKNTKKLKESWST